MPDLSINNVKTSIFYINDYHGKSLNMERTVSASNTFDLINKKNPEVDTFKLSSGDIMLGDDISTNKIAIMFQNFIGINSSAMGNHEYDIQGKIGEVIPFVKYNLLANNVKIRPENPLQKKLKPYIIEEKNGHKYGIIGTSPVDLFQRMKLGIFQRDLKLDNIRQTLADIQNSADELKEQGVNKIILLSHLGYCADKIVAQQTKGIDVILGGHSHELLFDIKEGKNLFYNKDGEPVVITQAGKNGENFGILNLEFDRNGIIKKVQNNIGYTKDFQRSMPARYVFDRILGVQQVFGRIESAPEPPKNYLIDINPHAYFVTDCIRKDLDNVDIVLLPSGNIRGFFEPGDVDSRLLADIMPFKNKLYNVKYSEKEIVDALKKGAESYTSLANKPGIFYASGLKYTVTDRGEIKSLFFVDKNGKETPIDLNNPRTDKYYNTIINDYCAEGNDNFTMLNQPDRIIKKYPFDATKCIENVLKNSKEPLKIQDDGRLKIIS